MTTQRPTRRQVLIPLTLAAAETVVANTASAVESCNKSLVSACSKLRVKSVRKAWDGVSMSTNSVASVAELEVIKQWLKKTAGFGEITEVEPFFFFVHQFITWYLIAVCGRLSTTSSL